MAKDLWFKLEGEYQKEKPEPEKTDHELEDKTSKEVKQEEEKKEVDSSKGMESFDCNDSLCYEIEKVLAEDDEGLSNVANDIHLTLISINHREYWVMNRVNINDSEFTKFKKKILDSLNEYQQKTMKMKVFLVKVKDKKLWD